MSEIWVTLKTWICQNKNKYTVKSQSKQLQASTHIHTEPPQPHSYSGDVSVSHEQEEASDPATKTKKKEREKLICRSSQTACSWHFNLQNTADVLYLLLLQFIFRQSKENQLLSWSSIMSVGGPEAQGLHGKPGPDPWSAGKHGMEECEGWGTGCAKDKSHYVWSKSLLAL